MCLVLQSTGRRTNVLRTFFFLGLRLDLECIRSTYTHTQTQTHQHTHKIKHTNTHKTMNIYVIMLCVRAECISLNEVSYLLKKCICARAQWCSYGFVWFKSVFICKFEVCFLLFAKCVSLHTPHTQSHTPTLLHTINNIGAYAFDRTIYVCRGHFTLIRGTWTKCGGRRSTQFVNISQVIVNC